MSAPILPNPQNHAIAAVNPLGLAAPVQPSAIAAVQPLGLAPPTQPGAMAVVQPLGRIIFALRGKDGRPIALDYRTPAQQQRHIQLHTNLTQAHLGTHPNVIINVKEGRLEAGGVPFHYLTSPQEKQDLEDLRSLYHEMLGQRYSSVTWQSYLPNDRAPKNAPLPFRKSPDIQGLDHFKIRKSDIEKIHVGKPQDEQDVINRRIAISRELLDKVDHRLTQHKMVVSQQHSLEAQSRAQNIEAARQIDKLAVEFTAFSPLELLPITPANNGRNADLLENQKNKAKEFLKEKDKFSTNFANLFRKGETSKFLGNREKEIDALATQLALNACRTREAYDFGCIHFDTPPSQTTTEMFVIGLTELLAPAGAPGSPGALPSTTTTAATQYVNDYFPFAYADIRNKHDRDFLKNTLLALVNDITSATRAPDFASPVKAPE